MYQKAVASGGPRYGLDGQSRKAAAAVAAKEEHRQARVAPQQERDQARAGVARERRQAPMRQWGINHRVQHPQGTVRRGSRATLSATMIECLIKLSGTASPMLPKLP
jgi:hypothetical protein